MKKSNKWAVALAVLIVAYYIGNMAYHKYNFDKNIRTYNPKDLFDTQRSRIKVVRIIDNKLLANNKIVILVKDKNGQPNLRHWMEDVKQQDAFFKSLIYSNDTLIIQADSLPIRFPKSKKSEITISIENVESVFYNDSLILGFK